MAHLGLYNYVARQPAASISDVTFTGPRVEEGQAIELSYFGVTDETTAGKRLRLTLDKKGVVHVLRDETLGAGVFGMRLERPIILVEGDAPSAVVVAPTLADQLTFIATGFFLPMSANPGVVTPIGGIIQVPG